MSLQSSNRDWEHQALLLVSPSACTHGHRGLVTVNRWLRASPVLLPARALSSLTKMGAPHCREQLLQVWKG